MYRKGFIIISGIVLAILIIKGSARLKADVYDLLEHAQLEHRRSLEYTVTQSEAASASSSSSKPSVCAISLSPRMQRFLDVDIPNYIQVYNTLEKGYMQIYHDAGGTTRCVSGANFLGPRGKVKSSPFTIGCWLEGNFNFQKQVWMLNDARGLSYSSFLDEDQQGEAEPNWYIDCLLKVFCCGCCCCYDYGDKEKAYKKYFMEKVGGKTMIQYLFDQLHVKTFKELGNSLQKNWCQPVAEMLQDVCAPKTAATVSFEHFVRIIELYRCYLGMDSASKSQLRFAQWDYENVSDRFHNWLLAVMWDNQDRRIQNFCMSMMEHWNTGDINKYVDRDSIEGMAIHPIGWYQIEFPLLYDKHISKITKSGTIEGKDEKEILKRMQVVRCLTRMGEEAKRAVDEKMQKYNEVVHALEIGRTMRAGAGL